MTGLQLSMFGDESPIGDQRPLPLIIAESFDFALQFHVIDGAHFFAVQDWIAGVAQTDNPRRLKSDMGRRFSQLYAACVQLEYAAPNGKSYKMDFADSITLYEITMRMGANTGIRNRVLRYLANSGEAMDQIRRNPAVALEIGIRLTSPATAIEKAKDAWRREGKSEEWIARRVDGMVARKSLTDVLRDVVEGITGKQYGQATGAIYLKLYEMTAAEIRTALGLPADAVIREHISAHGLKYLSIAETLIAERLTDAEHVMWEEALQIVRECAGVIGKGVRELEAFLGRSVATGRPLLEKGRREAPTH